MSKLRFEDRRVNARRLPLLCLACVLCGLIPFAFPRQAPQTQPARQMPTFGVLSNLVVVDVTVRDRKGNLIGDLTRNDFKVFEDNVPQELLTFSAESIPIGPVAVPAAAPANVASVVAAAAAPANAATVTPPKPGIVNLSLNTDEPVKSDELRGKRLIVMFFDLSSLGSGGGEDLIRAVDTARDFVNKQAGPQDLVAVATYSSALQLVQDLTNDKDVLLSTLNAISSPDSGDTVAEDLSDVDTSDDVFVPDTVQFNIFNTDRRMSAIETLAKMYREFPERKSLLYFSSGVTTTGVENNAQIRSTVDNANRSNMSIYTVDSRGLVAMPPGGRANQGSAGGRAMFTGAAMMRQRSNFSASQETLTTLAHDTGGMAFTDSNDLSLAIKQVQADTNIYYVLGYMSSNLKEDGKYRKIRVEVSRPDLKVEHRPGYFASKAFAQLSQQERDLQLQQALNVDRPFADVPVILQADFFRKDNNTSLVPISIELDGDGLKFEDKGSNKEGKFEFIAQVTDPKGRTTGIARDAVQVRLPADKAEKIKSGGIYYSTAFQLKPGDYNLKFLVRDNSTGKLGSFVEPITVPALDLKKLDTSSIVLGSQLTSARGDVGTGVAHQGMMRRFQELGIGYDPLVTGDAKIVPSIGNIFMNRQTVYVYFQVYGAAADPQTQKPSIETYLMLLNGNTKILESQPELVQDWTKERVGPVFGGMRGGGFGGRGGGPFGDRGGQRGPGVLPTEDRRGESTVAIALPLKSLKKGTYTLQIHVHDTVADVNLFRRVPIVIQ